jgi:hypothetical protein
MNKTIAFLFLTVNSIFCNAQADKQKPTTQQNDKIVFSCGFEEKNWRSVWDDYDGNPDSTNLLIENPGPFNKPGNHVMRLRVQGGRGGADIIKVFEKRHDKLYASWYEYWEPGYDFKARNHGSALFAGDRTYLGRSDNRPEGDQFASIGFEPDPQTGGRPFLYTYYRGMYMDCADPKGQCWGDHFPCMRSANYCSNPAHKADSTKMPPKLTTGKWYRIQLMMDMCTPAADISKADGTINFWIDGVEYGPWKNLWLRTTPNLQLSILSLGLFHHGAHSKEGVLIDDVVVSTEPIK